MSCLSSILSCCLPTKSLQSSKETPAEPHPTPHHDSPAPTYEHQDGYTQVTPLPAYTPRPMSIQEKTLEAHMRDPAISNETCHSHLSTDEKQRLAWEEATNPSEQTPHYYYPYSTHPRQEEATSDVSSAISFPSSYGNTSTATRETPPPPYSPRVLSPAPSRSMSISSAYHCAPTMHIATPPPVFQRPEAGRLPRGSIDDQLASTISRPRSSWESFERR
ncbi:hypothetical protein BJY04DRAFT_194936 [Aspergillus karnatakaensis]|uniref:uncharacterized protein n=1 Tax=Aspergillus karnatakaensis TaxID=1810916 RepID=UPI003CCD764A